MLSYLACLILILRGVLSILMNGPSLSTQPVVGTTILHCESDF